MIRGCCRVHSRRSAPCATACFMSASTAKIAAFACTCSRVRKSASVSGLSPSAGRFSLGCCGFGCPLGDVVAEAFTLGLFSLFILLHGLRPPRIRQFVHHYPRPEADQPEDQDS